MSRIGKKPIHVPDSVKVKLDRKACAIEVESPKGRLSYRYRPEVAVTWDENEKTIACSITEAQMKVGELRSYWGTVRACIANMIVGLTEGYQKQLRIEGVGWNAQAQGQTLRLNVGYCLPVEMTPPTGVQFEVSKNVITITGPDKQAVGEFASQIRAKRPPEPYNGKGIRYLGEHIIRKQGKIFGS